MNCGVSLPTPQRHATVQDMLGTEAETVAVCLTYRGTDTGGFLKGHPASGQSFEVGAICIWRMAIMRGPRGPDTGAAKGRAW